jgi:OHCU decarboxylase
VTLGELNGLFSEDAERAFLRCCGSRKWARQMADRRPFDSFADMLNAADRADSALDQEDWLEAFAAHPRIGERSESAWSQNEQTAALSAEEAVKHKIGQLNKEYDQKFGFIFIVFASGKTPEQILSLMEARLQNDRATEIANAAREQQQITRDRLRKLLEPA